MSRAKLNFVGHTVGKLTVLKEHHLRDKQKNVLWECICSCGKSVLVTSTDLRRGKQQSCGCLRGFIHGGSHTPEYAAWSAMHQRCKNLGDKNYGGRGIRVCTEWKNFETFRKDMGLRPGTGYSIERKNNNGEYSKANCIWATQKDQVKNMRTTRFLTFNGHTYSLIDWAEKLGLNLNTLHYRLRRGWSAEKALTTGITRQALTHESLSGDFHPGNN